MFDGREANLKILNQSQKADDQKQKMEEFYMEIEDKISRDSQEDGCKYQFNLFLKWRSLMTSNDKRDSIVETLRSFRNKYEDLVCSYKILGHRETTELCYITFCDLWDFLATLSEPHPLALPPIYRHQHITSILKTFTGSILVREIRNEQFQSGNILLSGVEGTGKTTLAVAMTLAVLICCKSFLLIYYDFKTSPIIPINNLTYEAFIRLENKDFSNSFGSYQAAPKKYTITALANKYKCRVGFIVDEVQVLYQNGSDHYNYNVLREIEAYARTTYRSFIVLTGSSSDLVSVLMNKKTNADGKVIVDFNRQLCISYNIAALRDITQLKHYLEARYGIKDVTKQDVSLLLYYTGGIGRWVHESMINQNYAYFQGEMIMTKRNDFMKTYEDASSYLFLIVGLLLVEIEETTMYQSLRKFAKFGDPFILDKCEGISHGKVVNYLRTVGVKDVPAVLDNLVDKGMLYMEYTLDQRSIQIALPQMMQCCFFGETTSSLSGETLAKLGGSYCTLYTKTGIHAGKAFEDLVRPRLYKLKGCGVFPANPLYRKLSLSATGIRLIESNGTEMVINNMEEIVGYLWNWKEEIGLDGVQFSIVSGPQKEVCIDGWQCKAGYIENEIGGGDLNTYRKSYETHGNVGKFNDDYVASIVVNAEIGFLTVLHCLQGMFPSSRFVLGTLFITSTKNGKLAKKMLNRLPNKIVVASEFISRFHLPATSVYQYEIVFKDTDEWFREILEPELRTFLPSPIVKTSPSCVLC